LIGYILYLFGIDEFKNHLRNETKFDLKVEKFFENEHGWTESYVSILNTSKIRIILMSVKCRLKNKDKTVAIDTHLLSNIGPGKEDIAHFVFTSHLLTPDSISCEGNILKYPQL